MATALSLCISWLIQCISGSIGVCTMVNEDNLPMYKT